MTSIILKVLALSGVVSAGCLAVWKANAELQPQAVGAFTEQSSEKGASPDAVADVEPTEAEPALALADFPTEVDETTAEAKNSARQMPSDFGGEPEPTIAPVRSIPPDLFGGEPAPELSDPEPGVADLGTLEKSAQRSIPEVSESGANLQKFPREAGGPELLKTPSPPARMSATPSRLKSSQGIVPAAGEETAGEETAADSAPVATPALRQRTPTVPAQPDPGAAASDLPAAELPLDLNQFETSPITAEPRPSSIPDAADGPSLLPTEEPGPGVPPNDFGAEPSDPVPTTRPGLRTRGPVPTLNTPAEETPTEETPEELAPATLPRRAPVAPLDEPSPSAEPTDWPDTAAPREAAPRRPTREVPTTIPADGVDPESEPRPRAGRSIPMPVVDDTQVVNPELLVGDGTVEDGLIKQSQQPQLKIEKVAQAEAEVGVSFIYEIVVQNVGQVDAHDVLVEERIPKGAKFELSKPQGRVSQDRIVRFPLDTIPAQTQKTIRIQIVPLEAGPIGSVATVRFSSKVAAKTIVTAPRLEFTVDAPKEVAVGEQVTYRFLIKNVGQGTARKSTLRVILPEGLHHPKGHDLDQELGALAPGQTVEKSLTFLAEEVARYSPEFLITANGLEQVNRQLDLSVIESRLSISRKGPAKRFVERPAEFETTVMNRSDQALAGVQVTEVLPVGVVPVGDRTGYRWDPKTRSVTWEIGTLGPGHIERLPLTVVARQPGSLTGTISAVDADNHRAELNTALEVQGFAALEVDFNGSGVPVNVGEQVSMRLTVKNGGSAPAKNVTAVFEVPAQMQFVSGTGQGEVTYNREGNLITFDPIGEIMPNSSQTYDIVLTAAQEGRANVSADLYSTDLEEKVRQEQQIRVVSDEP